MVDGPTTTTTTSPAGTYRGEEHFPLPPPPPSSSSLLPTLQDLQMSIRKLRCVSLISHDKHTDGWDCDSIII